MNSDSSFTCRCVEVHIGGLTHPWQMRWLPFVSTDASLPCSLFLLFLVSYFLFLVPHLVPCSLCSLFLLFLVSLSLVPHLVPCSLFPCSLFLVPHLVSTDASFSILAHHHLPRRRVQIHRQGGTLRDLTCEQRIRQGVFNQPENELGILRVSSAIDRDFNRPEIIKTMNVRAAHISVLTKMIDV